MPDAKTITPVMLSVLAFARAEAAKITPPGADPEAVATTALVHAVAAAVADCAGVGADAGRLLAVSDAAAGQVFETVHMLHALRTPDPEAFAARFAR